MSQLSTLFINDLVFSGLHGQTGREKLDHQNFGVNIKIHLDTTKAALSDNLHETFDYKNAVAVAKNVIENERHVLIEKIADRIVGRISLDPKVKFVEVEIRKLEASINGVPGIKVSKKRAPQELEGILDFNLKEILEKLEKEGGVSFFILPDSYRKTLLEEAESYEYHKQPEVVGPHKVREQLSSVKSFKEDSLFLRLKDDFQKIINHQIKDLENYFNPPLVFNEMSLQLYEKDSIGITPHMDGLSIKNIICIFILAGKARVALCDDREGNNARDLDTTPGNVILLRAPGFLDSDFRPFHFVSDVSERRIIFGLRQKLSSKEIK